MRHKPIKVKLVVGEISYQIIPFRDGIIYDRKRIPAIIYDPAHRPNRGRIIISNHTSNAIIGEAVAHAIRDGVSEMLRRREGRIRQP